MNYYNSSQLTVTYSEELKALLGYFGPEIWEREYIKGFIKLADVMPYHDTDAVVLDFGDNRSGFDHMLYELEHTLIPRLSARGAKRYFIVLSNKRATHCSARKLLVACREYIDEVSFFPEQRQAYLQLLHNNVQRQKPNYKQLPAEQRLKLRRRYVLPNLAVFANAR